jgi:hypothetical protein
MGKKRVTQLLEQLKENQQAGLKNSAAIYTVAQVAVNELQNQLDSETENAIAPLPVLAAALPVADTVAILDKADLVRQYGSHLGCRRAAKAQGIRFSKTPSWQQLIAAFSYIETFRELIAAYTTAHPHPGLHGMTIEIVLQNPSQKP